MEVFSNGFEVLRRKSFVEKTKEVRVPRRSRRHGSTYTTTAASMSDDVIDLASSEDEDGLVGEHPCARANTPRAILDSAFGR